MIGQRIYYIVQELNPAPCDPHMGRFAVNSPVTEVIGLLAILH